MAADNDIGNLITAIDGYLAAFESAGVQAVRDGISKWGNECSRRVIPQRLPALNHLDAALRAMDRPGLAKAIGAAAPHLRWITYDAYPRAEIGEQFANGHTFCSLIGEEAPVPASDFDLGLFLIAPRTLYRDHLHAAPELYAPLTGPHGWRFQPGDGFVRKAAHQPVWNEPHQPHATLTGDVPFLCIFCWTGNVNSPARVLPASDWGRYEP